MVVAMRWKLLTTLSLVACLCILPGSARAQATATERKAGDLQVGAGLSLVHPDYDRVNTIKGYTFYANFDFRTHYGVEGEFRQSGIGALSGEYERNYLIGPRYIFHFKRFTPYAKFLIGRGVFNYPPPPPPYKPANLAYNMLALGGGVDFIVLRHLNVRLVDFEYQRWLSFQKDTLTPTVITFGAAYHF